MTRPSPTPAFSSDGVPCADDPALRDHRDPVAERVGLEHVVRRQEDGLARVDETGDRRAQLAGADGVDADRGLVEEDDLRVVDDAPGDVQPLAHAAGVALDALLLAALQPDELEHLVDAQPLRLARHAVELGEVAEVVEGRQPFVEPAVAAEHVADPLTHRLRVRDDVVPSTRACPLVGSSRVISILIVVVLPAPFGPRRPKSSPCSTANDTPRTASTSSGLRRITPVVVR